MANEFKIRKGLIVEGASGGTVVDVLGSQGQLLSVTDNLSGSIFAVSDISGVPIFDVNSSGISYFDGKLGIGLTPTTVNLEVKSIQDISFDEGIGVVRSNTSQTGYINMVGGAMNINAPNAIPIKFRDGGNTNLTIGGDGHATFAGAAFFTGQGVAAYGSINLENEDPFIRLYDNGSGSTTDKKKWDIRVIGATGYESFDIRTVNDANTVFSTKLSIAHNGNTTFAAKATSLATAASDGSTTLTTKSYVDGLVTGVPVYKGTWAAGTTGVTSAAINGTTITLTAAPTETIAIGDVVTADGITGAITVTAVGSQTSVTVNASVTIAITTTVTFSPEGGYPDLTLAAAKVLGNYYIVSTAGSAAPNGSGVEPDSWAVGDWCIFSDVTPGAGTDLWQRIDNSSVISGAGTGGTIPLWEGATNAVSETLTDSPLTVSGTDTTFAGRATFQSAIADRPQLPGGFLAIDTSDADADIWGISQTYYPSNPTTANAWGLKWASGPNQFQWVGAGVNRITFDLDQGNIVTLGNVDVDGGTLNVGSSNQVNIVASGASLFPSLKVNNSGYLGSASVPTQMQLLSSGSTIFSGLVSGITPTAAANFTTKAYVDSFNPPTGTTQFFNQSSSYNNSTPGVTGYGNIVMDTSVSYYDTGKNVVVGTRGMVWTGKHYIFTDHSGNTAKFYNNNFDLITNPEASTITLPSSSSGGSNPHGAAWDGRYLYCINYSPMQILAYDLDNGTTTATVVSETDISSYSTVTYGIEYAEGHLYTCADGKVSKFKVEGKTITHVFTSGVILGTIDAQAITYDGSYLWFTQNGQNAYKVSLDCVLVATITTGLPPNNIGWAWNGQNVATVNYSTGDVYVLNTAETRFDTEEFLVMGGNVGIGVTNPSSKLTIETEAGVDTIELLAVNAATTKNKIIFSEAIQGDASFFIEHDGSGAGAANLLKIHGDGSGGTASGITIKRDGLVGIGTDNAQANLDVNGNSTDDRGLQIRCGDLSTHSDSAQIILSYNGNSYNSSGYAHSIRTRHNSGVATGNAIDFFLWSPTDTASTLGTKKVMTLEGTGNVGIGEDTPENILHIKTAAAGGPQIQLESTSGTAAAAFINFDSTNLQLSTQRDMVDGTWYDTAKSWGGINIQGPAGGSFITFQTAAASNTSPTERMRITSGGQLLINATSSGYGANNYGYNLGVRGAASQAFISIARSTQTLDTQGMIVGVDSNIGYLIMRDNLPIDFYNNNTFKMRIATSGNVGIGTTSPGSKLELGPNGSLGANITNKNVILNIDGGYGTTGTPSSGQYKVIGFTGTTKDVTDITGQTSGEVLKNFYLGMIGGDYFNVNRFSFWQGGDERLTIQGYGANAGNVGIGTTSPAAKLDVFSAASFRADVATGNPLISVVNNTAISNVAGTATIKFTQANTQAGGKIVSGRDGNYSSGATRTSNLQFYTSTNATDTEKMRITSIGNVGIGTTTPLAKLDIQGTQGQLFSVTDDLSGSIFAVADISGVPIFDVNSNGKVGINTTSANDIFDVRSPSWAARIQSTTDGTYLRMSPNQIATFNSANAGSPLYINHSSSGNIIMAGGGGVVLVGATSTPFNYGGSILHIGGTRATLGLKSSGTLATIALSSNNVSDKDIHINHDGLTGALNFYQYSVTPTSARVSMYLAGNGYLGLGTTSPDEKLTVNGITRSVDQLFFGAINTDNETYGPYIESSDDKGLKFDYNGNTGGEFQVWNHDQNGGGAFNAFNIDEDGNVGIDITSASDRLNVKGALSLYDTSAISTVIRLNPNGDSYINGGDLGVGITLPQHKLDVGGTIRSYNYRLAGNTTNPTTTAATIYDQSGVGLTLSAHNVELRNYNGSSMVRSVFFTHNTATFTGTCTATNFILSSDETLKENIKDIDNKHIDVNWKNFELKSEPGVKRSGVIAQELETKHPEFVRTNEDGLKSVAYVDLLIAKIAELEARLEKAGL